MMNDLLILLGTASFGIILRVGKEETVYFSGILDIR